MHLSETARARPGDVAAVDPDGAVLTFAGLDEASRRLANVYAANGLEPGDTIAILMPNTSRLQVAVWAALRSGLRFVPVNWHLRAAETVYIVADCAARALVTTSELGELAGQVIAGCPDLQLRLMADAPADGPFTDLDAAMDAAPTERPDPEPHGQFMFYSSGTTGRPKGIKPQQPEKSFGEPMTIEQFIGAAFGFDTATRYLSPGPMYHAAPAAWGIGAQALGGSVVIMARFDAEECLRLIEKHRITHAQFVPTMFVRLLKLPAEVRARYDTSSLRFVVHAAAPCPPDVKRQMIEWFGPIVVEYYAGSEGNGYFVATSEEWLAHPGTVGRALIGTPHILDDDGAEVPNGEVGQIWVESPLDFEYHNDPDKTAQAHNERGWSTLGDLGWLDADGFLHLSDRRTDLIISGGVNIYPREIEDALALHPSVADVAVVGTPDPEMGQSVLAVVQPADGATPGSDLADELIAHVSERLASFKKPRRVVFAEQLPRLPSGKILRRVVRDEYAR